MIAQLAQLYRLLSPRDRRNAAILFALMLVAALLEVLGVAAIPAFVAAVIDPARLRAIAWADQAIRAAGLSDPRALVLWGAAVMVVLFAVKTAVLVLNVSLQTRYMLNRRVDLSRRLLRAYLAAPYPHHLMRNRAELLRNVDHETLVISQHVIGVILQLCTKLTILLAVLAFLFAVEPLITLFWLGLFGAMAAVLVAWVGARLRRLAYKEQAERKNVVQTVLQALGAVKEARVLGRSDFFLRRVHETMQRQAKVARFRQTVARSVPPVTELAAVLGLLLLVLGLVALNRPTESILVTLSLFVVALVRLRETMSAAMTHLANLRTHLVSIEPVYADLKRFEAPARTPPPRMHLRQAIELRDVSFSYEAASEPSLNGVSLRIPAGAAVGFVGATGAGKSTLIDVILGLLVPTRGHVLIDGVDLHKAGAESWQRTIGYVPQNIYLLDDTLRHNIALGLDPSEIDELALRRAIGAAQLEGLLARLPQGLDTMVGEHGVRLSGGERQRIGIARALYHDPDVLVLDEATSALDSATERAVIEAVDGLKGRRTVLMVAHRLSTVRNCDTLYFLKGGRIEAEGNFSELKDSHAEFAAMASA